MEKAAAYAAERPHALILADVERPRRGQERDWAEVVEVMRAAVPPGERVHTLLAGFSVELRRVASAAAHEIAEGMCAAARAKAPRAFALFKVRVMVVAGSGVEPLALAA